MNPEVVSRTQRFLFASMEEMEEAHIPRPVQERLLRMRDIYNWWLLNPRLLDNAVVAEIMSRHHVSRTQAYEDLRLIKICLGNLNQCTADYYRYVFLQRAEEAFQMARDKGDPRAFAQALATFGKYTRLDLPDGNAPDYSQIVPQQFEITADPEAAGFRRIPDLEKKVRKMLASYIQDTAPAAGDGEIRPIFVRGEKAAPLPGRAGEAENQH